MRWRSSTYNWTTYVTLPRGIAFIKINSIRKFLQEKPISNIPAMIDFCDPFQIVLPHIYLLSSLIYLIFGQPAADENNIRDSMIN